LVSYAEQPEFALDRECAGISLLLRTLLLSLALEKPCNSGPLPLQEPLILLDPQKDRGGENFHSAMRLTSKNNFEGKQKGRPRAAFDQRGG
jgi:hypothetical protein